MKKTVKMVDEKKLAKERGFRGVIADAIERDMSYIQSCERRGINVNSFNTWLGKEENKDIKEEVRRIRSERTDQRYKNAVAIILTENTTMIEASRRAGVNRDVLSEYIKTKLDEETRNLIRKKANESGKLTRKKSYTQKNRRKRKTFSMAIEDLKKMAKNNKIDSLEMLDYLVKNKFEVPRKAFRIVLEKQGYKVVELSYE